MSIDTNLFRSVFHLELLLGNEKNSITDVVLTSTHALIFIFMMCPAKICTAWSGGVESVRADIPQ